MRTLILLFWLMALAALAADWPQFRGPAGTGIAPDTGLRTDWKVHPPKVRWMVALTDHGFSGPAVAGGVVYIIDHKGAKDIVRALDLRTGRERWRFAYADATKDIYGFARATPAVVDGRVYTLSRLGKLHCLDVKTGKSRWSRDIAADFKGVVPQWGYAMSPYVSGDAVVVCPGGLNAAVVALDRKTGTTLWAGGGSDVPGYATPTAAVIGGEKQYLVFAGAALLGVDAATGALRWRLPWSTPLEASVDRPEVRAHLNANAAVPIASGDTVFITTGYGHGSALVKVAGNAPVIAWSNKAMQAQYSTPVLIGGYLYGTSDPRTLVCQEMATGKVAWSVTGIGRGGGLCAANGLLVILDGNSGEVIIVRATPKKYLELGRCTPLGGESRTAPIIADGCLIVRNRTALACVPLK